MDHLNITVEVFKGIEHLVQKEASSILTKSAPIRALNKVEHVEVAAAKILRDQVHILVIVVNLALHMHNTVVAVSEEAQDVFMLQLSMVLYFFLHLLSVSALDISSRSQYLHHNLLATILPVL